MDDPGDLAIEDHPERRRRIVAVPFERGLKDLDFHRSVADLVQVLGQGRGDAGDGARLQRVLESLKLRGEADVGKDLNTLRPNSTKGIEEAQALRLHQQGDGQGCGAAHADFTVNEQLGLGIACRRGRCEVEELGKRPCDVLMHSIVDVEKQMMKLVLQERHLRSVILHETADHMGDSCLLQLLNLLFVRSGAQIQGPSDLTEEALTQVDGEIQSKTEP